MNPKTTSSNLRRIYFLTALGNRIYYNISKHFRAAGIFKTPYNKYICRQYNLTDIPLIDYEIIQITDDFSPNNKESNYHGNFSEAHLYLKSIFKKQ